MEKKKFLIVGLIGLLLLLVFVFIGCDEPEKCSGDCEYHPNDNCSGSWKNGIICHNYDDQSTMSASCSKECNAFIERNKSLQNREVREVGEVSEVKEICIWVYGCSCN